MQAPVKIFVVYAHEDKPVRDKLLRQLRPLADRGEIDLWSDHEIKPGALWDEEIRLRLTQSEIILLLVSDDFFASDYIRRVELQTALDLHSRSETVLLPIIARHCGWTDLPALSRLQVLPPEGRPVLSKEWDSPDEPYLKVYEGVKIAVRELRRRHQTSILPSDTLSGTLTSYSPGRINRKWWLLAAALLLVIVIWMIKCLSCEHKSLEIASPVRSLPDSPAFHQKLIDTASNVSVLNSDEISKEPVREEKKRPFRTEETTRLSSKPVQPRIASPKDNMVTNPPPLYDRKLETSEGMTRIIKGKQQSFLNSSGQWIGFWFDDATNFYNGVADVKLNGRRFQIDKTGQCVKDCE